MNAENGGSMKRRAATCNTVNATNSKGSSHIRRFQRRRRGAKIRRLRACVIVLASPSKRIHRLPIISIPTMPATPRDHDTLTRFLLPTAGVRGVPVHLDERSEEHTSELQSLMRLSYAVFCLNKQ